MTRVYTKRLRESHLYRHTKVCEQIAEMINNHCPGQLLEIEKTVHNTNSEVNRHRVVPDILVNEEVAIELERCVKLSIASKVKDLSKMGLNPIVILDIELPSEIRDRIFILLTFGEDKKEFIFGDQSDFFERVLNHHEKVKK